MVAVTWELREMRLVDLPHVLRNERRGYTHPWSEGIFRDCVKSGHDCWLLVYQNRIVGHGIISVAASESHLLNVCVHPDCQGNGFGRILTSHLMERAQELSADRMFLEVRPSNHAAVSLYESLGFNEIGVRPDYYPAYIGREDAQVMAIEFLPSDDE